MFSEICYRFNKDARYHQMTPGHLLCMTYSWEMKEVRLILLLPGMFSTGLVITVDIKPDGVIKINNRPLKIFDYTNYLRAQILECASQNHSAYVMSYS